MTTSKDQLKENVQHIVNSIENGHKHDYCPECDCDLEGHDVCPECGNEFLYCDGLDYLSDVLDIEYYVASDRETINGARLLVAFGGPNIWIDTRFKRVEGYWWSEKFIASYSHDEIGLDEAVETLFHC